MLRGNRQDRLTQVTQLVLRQKRLVGKDRSKTIVAVDVTGGKDSDHPRYFSSTIQIDGLDPPGGDRATEEIDPQLTELWDVIIDIRRRTGHMTTSRIMRDGFSDRRHGGVPNGLFYVVTRAAVA